MNLSLFYPLLAALPVGLLAMVVAVWRLIDRTKGRKQPVNEGEKFLRTPGLSAFDKVCQFNDKMEDTLPWFTTLPALLLVGLLGLKISGKPTRPHLSEIILASFTVVFICLAARLIYLAKERRKWDLGFRGERAVGEYLNQLMLEDCRVFHDFPLNGDRNLDHIVVARSGVYAIETKAKRKGSSAPEDGIIKFDGTQLIFPHEKWNVDNVSQAARQAADLHDEIREELGIDIWVNAVLVLPGWEIERTGRGRGIVTVLNHNKLRSAIVDGKHILTAEGIRRIAEHLDKRCRDVAF